MEASGEKSALFITLLEHLVLIAVGHLSS